MTISKQVKQGKRNHTLNKRYKTLLKNARNNLKKSNSAEELRVLQKAARKAAHKGVIHSNKASRIVSRAMARVNRDVA